MDEKYSKRKVSFDEEEPETSYDSSGFDQAIDDYGSDDGDDYGIEDLITDLESGSSDIGYDDMDLSDFDEEEDDYTIDDLLNELESDDYEELDSEFIDQEVLGDAGSANVKDGKKYDAEDFVIFLESEEEFGLKPIHNENDSDFISEEDGDISVSISEDNSIPVSEEDEDNNVVFDVFQDDSEDDLEIKNKSIKLDLWLKECVEEEALNQFLKYKIFSPESDESQISAIISNFELEEILEFKYKFYVEDFKNILMRFFLPMGVMSLVKIAEKYSASISLTKDGLIKNFLDTFSPYELILIFNEEGLNINDYLHISVLEQIYLLSDSKLKEISYKLFSKGDDSRHGMISFIVNYYDNKYLISHEIFRGDAL